MGARLPLSAGTPAVCSWPAGTVFEEQTFSSILVCKLPVEGNSHLREGLLGVLAGLLAATVLGRGVWSGSRRSGTASERGSRASHGPGEPEGTRVLLLGLLSRF